MKAMMNGAGALMLATLLAACGGGGGGSDNSEGGVAVAPVVQAEVVPQAPVATQPAVTADGGIAPVEAATSPADDMHVMAVTNVADDSWVQTWNDTDIDNWYPSRPIKVVINGQGSVTNTAHGDAGPLCTVGTVDCTLKYGKYETVTLVAYPKAGMVFRGWSGGCIGAGMATTCKITNSIGHTVLAVFGPA